MASYWITLQSIPATGKEFVLDDQSVWTDPIAEFGVACRIVQSMRASVFVLPQEGAVLVRGRIQGTVALACNRCMEEAAVEINQPFDSFEPFPALPGEAEEDDGLDVDREVMRLAPQSQGVEMNLAALVWEEFSLALPVKPLCDTLCKGLCPTCGANRNITPCDCKEEAGDPRLAVLRGLTIRR